MQTERAGTIKAAMGRANRVSAGIGPLVAVLDIGGTKIAGALADEAGAITARTQHPTPAAEGGETVLAAVSGVLAELASAPGWDRVRCVGVASAGPIDAVRGSVSPVNIPGWREFPLVERIRRDPAVSGLPVVLIGDGVAMTAAEHWRGAAQGFGSALGMVVSTGVGGGLVLGGSVHLGTTGNAGHIGHTSVDMDGDRCPCGSRGCVELMASGTAIARRAREAGWRPDSEDASAAAVARAAQAGDPVAHAVFERAARALAAAIAATAAMVEIDVVVIGGGVARSGELLLGLVRTSLDEYATLPFIRGIEVRPAELGDDAGLVGAAAAAFELLGVDRAAVASAPVG